jgi:polyisoprenoid-binding protein YceI
MKTSKISMIVAAVTLFTMGGTSAMAQKKVTLSDAVGKNQFTWTSDAPLEKIKGTAEGVSGSLTVDKSNIAATRGTISAQVSTMKSGNGTRDGHLKSAQWLDAAKYPTITFTIASVSNVKTTGNVSTGTATGTFTMHGVTKTVAVPFKLTYVDASAKTRERAPGDLVMISADFNISLADFQVAGTKGTIGSKVGEKIHVTAQLFGSTGN